MREIPVSKVAQTTEILREAILAGEWVEALPGERTLARELMISRACLRDALDILTRDGYLAPSEPSKKRLIRKRVNVDRRLERKAIFFTPEPAHKAAPLVLEQLAQLRYHLSRAGMSVELVSSPIFKHRQTSDAIMQQHLNEHPHAHWILHQCPEHIQQWFSRHALRATVLGSLFKEIKLPFIDIDFQSASRHATGRLIAKGHRRIGMIRFRSHLAGDDLAVEGMLEAIKAHRGEALPEPVSLSHNFHVERLTNSLSELFKSPTPPTGLIVLNHHHFVTAFSHLLSQGIRIPHDVSILSLTHDAVLDRLSPVPASYTVGDQLISELAQRIINPTARTNPKSSLLVSEAILGQTVSSPP